MAKSLRYQFNLDGGRKATFTRKGRKRYVVDQFEVLVNCDVEFADGSRHDGVLAFDESSSGEHCGTYILTNTGIVSQDEIEFKMGKGPSEVFPYRYRYRVPLQCSDHHVDPSSGWSR